MILPYRMVKMGSAGLSGIQKDLDDYRIKTIDSK
jgi:hypothetical protein